MKTITLSLTTSINGSSLRAFLLLPFVLVCFALAPVAEAQCPQICDSGHQNTALGDSALISLTTGTDNTAIGFEALFSNTTGFENTALGSQALSNNNPSGHLFEGDLNTAIGFKALYNNTTGVENTATGHDALMNNTVGVSNTAVGSYALAGNTTGGANTAIGRYALAGNTGSGNIAVGDSAGVDLRTGDNNIDIGSFGFPDESRTIRIGSKTVHNATLIAGISGTTVPTGVAVIVDSRGRLGTTTSSSRFKEAIKPMDAASEAILALKPVTFRYKKELDPEGTPQFGLVAEDVEKVNPNLVACDERGKPYTVRYDAVNAMLLNEFLKEHRQVTELKTTVAQQQQQIEKLTAALSRQARQIEQVSAQVEAIHPGTRLVVEK